jgi:hypothetical protein
MTLSSAPSYELPEGWFWPDADESESLHKELQSELPPGHLLYGLQIRVFATRRGIDDVLFRHVDMPDRFTVIHLTWLGRTEIDKFHPTVEFDGSFSEFLEEDGRITAFLKKVAREQKI